MVAFWWESCRAREREREGERSVKKLLFQDMTAVSREHPESHRNCDESLH